MKQNKTFSINLEGWTFRTTFYTKSNGIGVSFYFNYTDRTYQKLIKEEMNRLGLKIEKG